jgi:hypothetical protein
MSTQYRLVQSGKTASGSCSAGPRFVRAVAPRIYYFIKLFVWKISLEIIAMSAIFLICYIVEAKLMVLHVVTHHTQLIWLRLRFTVPNLSENWVV